MLLSRVRSFTFIPTKSACWRNNPIASRSYAVAVEKTIEVILTQNLKNNVKGDLIKVKRGYARNYLLPRQIALIPTEENLKFFGQSGKVDDATLLRMKNEAALRKKISRDIITIKRHKVGEVPHSPIDANTIVEKLWKYRRLLLKPSQIEFSTPTSPFFNSFGEFQVTTKIGAGTAPLKIRVVPR